jgi:tRNA U34 5-methylaminomethyl-2-thiouridine-forming methyltransferase MnmC
LKKEVIITSDGSHTLFVPKLNETYHSMHGAIQESAHVFIKEGFEFISSKNTISILEVGFGTGLNALMTLLAASYSKRKVKFTSLEAYPLEWEIVSQLNYLSQNLAVVDSAIFAKMHHCSWGLDFQINSFFSLKKLKLKLQEAIFEGEFDLIYFDAFAPLIQPELWTEKIFESMFKSLSLGGVLVTYCAKGSVKRTMKAVGFHLQSIPGPPGKREMTRAIKRETKE